MEKKFEEPKIIKPSGEEIDSLENVEVDLSEKEINKPSEKLDELIDGLIKDWEEENDKKIEDSDIVDQLHMSDKLLEEVERRIEEKEEKEKKEREDFDYSRKAAQITLARIDDFQDLWSETEQEGNEKFIKKTKEAWKEFVVHGVIGMDKKTKEKTILNFTDLDGKCSLALLKLAGINTKDVEYVKPGESKDGKINLDTGDRHGLVVEDEGKTVFMDHHGDESGKDISATKVVYDVLTSLELLKKEEYLDKLVDFVTQVDNKTYPNGEEHFKSSWQTIFGLQRFIQSKHLIDFFKENRDPSEKLSRDDLKKMGLLGRSKEQKEVVKSSLLELERMDSNGLIVPSDYYGKIAVDINKKIRGGFDAAKAFGCENYIIWAPKEKSFFISTTKSLADKFNLNQGKRVRNTMWIKPRQDGIPLTIKLQEILNEMTDGKFNSESELKEFLEKEMSNIEEEFSWILELSENEAEQGKIKYLFDKILELSKKVDIYEDLDEKSLEQIAINQTKKSFDGYKK